MRYVWVCRSPCDGLLPSLICLFQSLPILLVLDSLSFLTNSSSFLKKILLTFVLLHLSGRSPNMRAGSQCDGSCRGRRWIQNIVSLRFCWTHMVRFHVVLVPGIKAHSVLCDHLLLPALCAEASRRTFNTVSGFDASGTHPRAAVVGCQCIFPCTQLSECTEKCRLFVGGHVVRGFWPWPSLIFE